MPVDHCRKSGENGGFDGKRILRWVSVGYGDAHVVIESEVVTG